MSKKLIMLSISGTDVGKLKDVYQALKEHSAKYDFVFIQEEVKPASLTVFKKYLEGMLEYVQNIEKEQEKINKVLKEKTENIEPERKAILDKIEKKAIDVAKSVKGGNVNGS